VLTHCGLDQQNTWETWEGLAAHRGGHHLSPLPFFTSGEDSRGPVWKVGVL
jgi:hypothetical protein